MAKKFFYNKVYNTKRTIINFIIIGLCVVGIIVCFIITSNFQGENQNTPEGNLSIKKEVTIEVNEEISKEMFFSKIENFDIDSIEIKYPKDFDASKVGKYEIILNINNEDYTTTLNIIDITKPTLTLKDLTIKEGSTYKANDFVQNCTDNSNTNCVIAFSNSNLDEDGNIANFSNYKEAGTYVVKISAKDGSGNETIEEAKLIIKKGNNTNPPTTQTTCKYGDSSYNSNEYLLTIDITSNKCAVSLDSYKSSNNTEAINKLMDTETLKIKKDINALNLTGTLSLNRKVTAIINNTGDGIVGYELRMTVTLTHDDKSEVIADYKIDNKGKRVFITNSLNLAN